MKRLNRRQFFVSLVAVGASAAGLAAGSGCGILPGSTPPKPPLIGWVHNVPASDAVDIVDSFRQGLREQGLGEGENLRIEWRWADGQNERLPALTTELIDLGVKLIVTSGATAPGTVQQVVGDRLPIVLLHGATDPSGQGLPVSMARPGANVTGTTGFWTEPKIVELLALLMPMAHRLAHMTNLTVPSADLRRDVVADAAQRLGLELLVLDVRRSEDTERAFQQALQWGADALFPRNIIPLNMPRDLIPALAARARLPVICGAREWVAAGLLISYAYDVRILARRTAWYVARVLNGADPGQLPMERPTAFEVVLNRTALANLGLTVPPELAVQITEWIG